MANKFLPVVDENNAPLWIAELEDGSWVAVERDPSVTVEFNEINLANFKDTDGKRGNEKDWRKFYTLDSVSTPKTKAKKVVTARRAGPIKPVSITGLPGQIDVIRIEGNVGTSPIELPVFADDAFHSELRPLIVPPGYEYLDHSGIVHLIAASWIIGKSPLLNGPAGIGKTSAFKYLSSIMRQPYIRYPLKGTSHPDDLDGYRDIVHDKSGKVNAVWVYARFVFGFKEGALILLDEYDKCGDEVRQHLRPALDQIPGEIFLEGNNRERIVADPRTRVGAACNPPWDPRYGNSSLLDPADQRRVSHIFMNYPPKSIEEKLIDMNAPGIGSGEKQIIFAIAKAVRELVPDGFPVDFGTDVIINWAKATPLLGLKEGLKLVVLDGLPPENKQAVEALMKIHMPA